MKAFWKGVTVAGVVAVVGAAALVLHAQGGPGRHGWGPGGDAMQGARGEHSDRMAMDLGLSDEQKTAWEQQHREFQESMRATFEKQRPLHEQLRAALDADQPDAAAVGRLMIAVHQQRKAAEKQHDALRQRLRALLTPEQQTKFDALHAQRKSDKHGAGGHGMMMFGGPGGPGGGQHGPCPCCCGGPGGPRGPRPDDEGLDSGPGDGVPPQGGGPGGPGGPPPTGF